MNLAVSSRGGRLKTSGEKRAWAGRSEGGTRRERNPSEDPYVKVEGKRREGSAKEGETVGTTSVLPLG